MKICPRVPHRWDTRGVWESRLHALVCPVCRRSWQADRRLARQARLLHREPVPPGLEAQLVRRLGLAETGAPARRQFQGRVRPALLAFAAVAGIGGVALILWPILAPGGRQSAVRRPVPSVLPLAGLGPSRPGTAHATKGGTSEKRTALVRDVKKSDDERSGRRVEGVPVPVPSVGSTGDLARVARHSTADEDDLDYMNADPVARLGWWAQMSPEEHAVRTARLRAIVRQGDDFVSVPLPRIAASGAGGDRAAAEAVAAYKREVAVVDPRLMRAVTLSFKATALSDLCDQIRAETGIHLVAGRSVADEKVTLFCRETPLRDAMRQLSRPFGYTWLRSGSPSPSGGGAEGRGYRYELVQDLRSQLMEEDLRNRDRNAALLALDDEMQRYRKYLGLSPDEALARSRSALPEEKKLLERYGSGGWGLFQLYFRLSPNDLNAMRSGRQITFSAEPKPDEQPLPPGLERGILQSQRERRIVQVEGRYRVLPLNAPEGLLPAAVPEVRAQVKIQIRQSELGQFTFGGGPGIFVSKDSAIPGTFSVFGAAGADNLAVGESPAVRNPKNGTLNAKWERDPGMRKPVVVRPKPSCDGDAPKVTSADVLEALHQATGRPIVADFYTRLYPVSEVSAQNTTLFDALNRVADRMRLRWNKEDAWLQFRSTSFFHDRLKEVPNRLLAGWAASRRQHGTLTLDDLIEIAGLSDAQLDASDMAEGARLCYGLEEWSLPRIKHLRAALRFFAEFTPAQRQEAQRVEGLSFVRMTLAQQQGYLSRAFHSRHNPDLGRLSEATLHADYTVPGWFRWSPPGRVCRPSPVRERTREAALQAARRIDPQVPEAQITPTRLDVTFLFSPSPTGAVRLERTTDSGWLEAP